VEGGLTPSFGLIKRVLARVRIPVHVLVRPRAGDFLYRQVHWPFVTLILCCSAEELEVIKEDIAMCAQLRVAGVVCGVLNRDGTVDEERTRSVRPVTCSEDAGAQRVCESRWFGVGSFPSCHRHDA